MKTLIKGGTVITDVETYPADLLVEGEKIALLGTNLPSDENIRTIDAQGKLIMPGGVDAHVHLDLPMFGTVSSDDHYSGTKAAAFGGTTTVIDFVPQDFPTLKACIDAWHSKADGKAAVDFSFHMNITRFDDHIAKEIIELHTEGISSLKVFTAYNGRLRLSDGNIFKILRISGENGLLTLLHAENGDVIEILIAEALKEGHLSTEWHALTRPSWGAVESVLRGAALAAQAKAPLYVVHMNVAGEVDQLAYAREHGLPIMGETCPQYLFFTSDDLLRPDGAKWICSPPVRSKADNEHIWQGINQGIIQVLSTDHCPFFFDGTKPITYEGKTVKIPGKELGKGDFTKIPNGLPGVGDRIPVFWTKGVGEKRISPNQFVALTSTNPAKIFGLYPQKGSLMPGSDADILIWDANKPMIHGVAVSHQRTDYNLYEGWKLKGCLDKLFLRGQLIVDGTQWLGKAGMGKYQRRSPHGVIL